MTKRDDKEYEDFLNDISDEAKDVYKPENWVPRNLKNYGNTFVNTKTYEKLDWEKIRVEVGCKSLDFTFVKATESGAKDGYVVTVIKK